MYLTIDELMGILTVFGIFIGFLAYRCGKSDQRDAEERAAITKQFEDYRQALRGKHGN